MNANPLPRISIAVPSFNQGQYLEDTLTSLLDQNYPNLEIFVCDGGSTDSSVEVLKKYGAQLSFWVSEKDKGQTDAINKGLRRATGQILAYLNSDDFLLPNALHAVAQAYAAHPRAGLYSGNGLIVDGRKEQPRLYLPQMGYSYESMLRGSCYLLQPSTFINRIAWEKAGEFDDSLRFAMDLDYWLRVGKDFEVVLVNAPLSAWRMHEDIKTASGGMARWTELWRLYRKHMPEQLTPGLLVELFSILQQPAISRQLGMDIRELAGQCFKAAYSEMQKTLKLRDCVPVGSGIIFNPTTPAEPPPFRAYPPRPREARPAAVEVAVPPPAAAPAGGMVNRPGNARVDIVLQATGVHAWAVGGGWENAARKLGVHHRTFRPAADWGALEPRLDDGLFDYLADPQAEVLLLAGFDWHSQPLHSHPRWRNRWQRCRARKILYVQESVLHHEKLSGTKAMAQAFQQAAALVDAIIYTDLADRPLMESVGKPVLFQPFGVDDQVFVSRTPFAQRVPRAFFRGKHQPFAGQAASYGDRRALIQHLLDHRLLELVPYQPKPVTPEELAADFNRFQVAANFPSVFANHPTRLYEAMACGCAVVTNRTGIDEIDRQFEHGKHLLYYSTREELRQAVQRLAAEPAFAAALAAAGQREALEKHALSHRLAEAVRWAASLPAPAAPQAGAATVSTPARTIVIDGVIFDWQRGRPHGISRVWHRLLEQLARTPLAPDIVLLDRDGTAPVIPGIRRRTVAAYDRLRFEADSLWVQRWCDEEKAGLFISTYFTYAETTPSVLLLHDMIPELTGQNLANPEWRGKARALQRAVGYLAVSQSTINDFHRLHRELAGRPVFLAPNAVGDELQPPSAEAGREFRKKYGVKKPYFLLVGNRGDYKNARLFFRAFAQLPRRQAYEIVCVGGLPRLEEDLQALVPGTACHVLRLDDAELSAAYAGALALAYPSRYEGFGLPILEAQKCRCPVITCRNSSLPEVGGDSVIYVGEADEAAMREALLEVQKEGPRQSLIAAGERNRARFSWDDTGKKVREAVESFQQLAARLPRRAGDPLDTLRRFIFVLDQGDDTARRLGVQLRIIAWQYDGLERFTHERAGAAEAEAAKLLNRLEPGFLQRLAPLADLDALTALALGLAAEFRQDWYNARAFYLHALTRPTGGILGLRLAVRLARIAAHAGDTGVAESIRRQILPKLRATLPAGLNAEAEEKAVLEVPPPAAPKAPPVFRPFSATHQPLVTAIVSTFKSERFIRGCLEDLEAQTLADRLEIVVVDSHSPQNERAIVEEFQKRYPNIVYIRTEERETVYGAWNRGVRAARGRYLTNANTDDRHRADALEILARTLDENPEVSLVYADCLITPHENETYQTGNPTGVYNWLDFNARDLWGTGCFCGPQPMWRREVHAEHGYFDAAMISAGDYEFWLRLAQNRKFLHVREVLGLYLRSPASVEHANGEAGAREVGLARERYRGAIMGGKPPFRPQLPDAAKVDVMSGGGPAPAAGQPAGRPVPRVARVGCLSHARELFAAKNSPAAWAAACAAIGSRPFHPEGHLLLAEIARAAGAGKLAKECARHARELAPGWAPAKQFLNQPLKGDARPEWMVWPAVQPGAAAPAGPRLSVCLIVKNEERFLAQCLKSVRELATQIVVVDTGSTDRTVEIAREFGAETHAFAWTGDFAAARNAALEHATGDWVLVLDADEELPVSEHPKVRADISQAATIAFRLPLVNVGREKEGRAYVPRLFRNAPGIFFKGRIHEQVFASLLAFGQPFGLKSALGTAQLLHHGYTEEMMNDRNKIERNLKLLRAAVAEDPNDVNLTMNLGLELVRSGDLGAGLEKYREAYERMSTQGAPATSPELREALLTQFTGQLYKVNRHEEVVRILTSPLARRGGLTASLHFALGLAHFELKQFSEAASQMRQCLAKRRQPSLTPISVDILTAAPQHCLALCLARLGEAAAAEKAFTAALQETGNVEPALMDYAKFLKNAKRPVEALHQLHRLVTANARDLAAWQLGGAIALSQPDFLAFARDWTGEALRAWPESPVIATQRAEALLLNGDAAEAAPLWEKMWRSEHDPRVLAALILCETVEGRNHHAPNPGPDEQATSRAFVAWYQTLISMRVHGLREKINAQLERLSRTLPGAADMLRSALAEADAKSPVGDGVAP